MQRRAERQLLRKIRQGSREACEELVGNYYASIYRFLAHLTRDPHLAEDLTQDTFAAAWSNIAAFEGRALLGTWLHRIAYRKFIDSTRAAQYHAANRERLKHERSSHVTGPGPREDVLADERERFLYDAIHGLEESDQVVIVLHYLQGLSFREVSSVLDEPTGTVKARTSRALRRLRDRLDGRI